MRISITDDGTMDTVVVIYTKHGEVIERFDTEYRYSFDDDPDVSTDYFLEAIRDDMQDSLSWNEYVGDFV